MISSKKLIKLAKRWQKFAAIRRKRISFPSLYDDADSCSTSSAVYKGHFTIYTADQKRFVVPLSYLENEIIRQLLSMSEEEFGLPSDGPITLPCDAVFMEYIISLLSRGLSRELENALLVSVTSHRCSSAPLHQEGQTSCADAVQMLCSPGTWVWLLKSVRKLGSKRLIKLTKRWQKFAAIRRKRISFPSLNDDTHSCSTSSAVSKGHFVVYTADQKRFVIPLSYLENEIIRQLLNMSEEEFGLPSDGPITLPCDAVFMEYIISLLSRDLSRELESALLVSVTSHRCSSAPLHQEGWRNQELLVC
nr:auxin-responsive protein SAUR68-like [Ipomoea batatas]